MDNYNNNSNFYNPSYSNTSSPSRQRPNNQGKIIEKLTENDGYKTTTTLKTTTYETEKVTVVKPKGKQFSISAGDNLGDHNVKEQAMKFAEDKPIKVDDSDDMISMSLSREEETHNIEYLLSRPVIEILQTFDYHPHEESDFEPFFDNVLIENRFIRLYKGKHKKVGNCCVLVLNDVKTKKQQFVNLLKHLKSYYSSTKHHVLLKQLGCINLEKQGKVYLLFEPVLTTFQQKKDKNILDNNMKFVTLFNLLEYLMECHESNKLQFHSLRFDNLLYNVYDDLRVLPPSGNITFIIYN